jgi:hypothetical protein
MGFKHDDRCLAKVGDTEPIFVLRAQDLLAPAIIRLWADLAALEGADEAKLYEARACAARMEAWPSRKFPD